MANPEHVKVVKEGKEAIELWLKKHSEKRFDLSKADLSEANLSEANLLGANLSGSDLSGAHLSWANLTGANLAGATCRYTTFANCDLGQFIGLESVVHEGPSTIGIDTIIISNGKIPRAFLLGSGMTSEIVDALLALISGEKKYYRCFISYTSLDEKFATRLHKDLETRDVPCWKYDEDAVGGRKVWANIDRAIQDNDKVEVICSENSLQRDGVPREIERALQKEDTLKAENKRRKSEALKQGEKPDLLDEDVLVPVRLDGYVLNEWQHPRKTDVLATHVLNFSGWHDEAKYQETFQRLLIALDPKTWGPV